MSKNKIGTDGCSSVKCPSVISEVSPTLYETLNDKIFQNFWIARLPPGNEILFIIVVGTATFY